MTNIILIEIGTEELPFKNLNFILFRMNISLEYILKSKNLCFKILDKAISIRRISFLIKIEYKKYIKKHIKSTIEKLLKSTKTFSNMRWGRNKNTFIRPIKWYVLMAENDVMQHKIFDINNKKKKKFM